MRRGLWLTILVVAGVVALMACAPAAPQVAKPTEKMRLLYLSSIPGSSYYIAAVSRAKVWNTKVPEVEVTVMTGGGCGEATLRLGKGEVQLGDSCPDTIYRAMKGLMDFKDKPITNHRYMYAAFLAPVTLVVRADTDIKSLKDLEGKDFNPGPRASSTEAMVKLSFETLGFKPKLYSGGIEDAVAAYKDRRIVGFVKAQGGPKAWDATTLDAHIAVPLRFLSFTKEEAAKVEQAHPYYSFMTVSKDALSPGVPDQDIATLSIVSGAGVDAKVPADLVYKMTKASIEDNKPGGEGIQASAVPALKGVDFVKLTLETATTVPLHAGAYKYYKELGVQLTDAMMPPELQK